MENLNICEKCESQINENANFCPVCGHEKRSVKNNIRIEINNIISVIGYYFILLSLFLFYKHFDFFNDSIQSEILVDSIFIIITIIYSLLYGREVFKLLLKKPPLPKVVILMVVVFCSSAVVVFFFSEWLNFTLFESSIYYFDRYVKYTDNPWLVATLLVCVVPAIFEELAFRGFLFNKIEVLSGTQSAVIITSFLFAFLHVSIIGLFWLLPLGFLLAIIRSRYKTIIYGMVGHFCYNFTILYLEYLMY